MEVTMYYVRGTVNPVTKSYLPSGLGAMTTTSHHLDSSIVPPSTADAMDADLFSPQSSMKAFKGVKRFHPPSSWDKNCNLSVDNSVNTHITKTEYISEEQRVSNIALFYLSDIN